jgi:hypothetical protein
MQLVEEQAAPRLIGLEPFAIDDQLRDGTLAHMAEDFGGGGGVKIDVDLGVFDSVGFEELLGSPAIAAPGSGVNLHLHSPILAVWRCYPL